jgi:hypothetical protein
MISRLTLSAVVFAVLGTASLGFAAPSQLPRAMSRTAVAAEPLQVIQLPRVEIIGHRAH